MPDRFRLRPLHRQRHGSRKTVRVLNQEELCALLEVDPAHLPARLGELDWPFHRDSAGSIWATERPLPRGR